MCAWIGAHSDVTPSTYRYPNGGSVAPRDQGRDRYTRDEHNKTGEGNDQSG